MTDEVKAAVERVILEAAERMHVDLGSDLSWSEETAASRDWLIGLARLALEPILPRDTMGIGSREFYVLESASWSWIAKAQQARATKAEAERDEAIKDRDAQAAHVLKVAAEARDGFAALEEIDACWDAYGTASNRMNLTLSEQIASTLRELEDMSENYGNAEGELKMAQAEIEELRTAARSAQKEGA